MFAGTLSNPETTAAAATPSEDRGLGHHASQAQHTLSTCCLSCMTIAAIISGQDHGIFSQIALDTSQSTITPCERKVVDTGHQERANMSHFVLGQYRFGLGVHRLCMLILVGHSKTS